MKFDKLILKDFRSHEHTTLHLDRINVVRGLNGAGKSSIQMAVELALTGRCSVTDAAGRGAEDLIRSDAKELGVQLTAGDVVIEARRNRTGLTQTVRAGKSVFTGAQAKGWIAENLAPTDTLSAVLNSSRFPSLPEKEQKALLADALASDPVEIDPAIFKLANDCGCLGNPAVESASQVDRWHKGAFEARANAKRELKALGELVEPKIPADCPTLAQVILQLGELETMKDALSGQMRQTDIKVERENGKLRAEYSEKKAKLDAAQRTITEFDSWVIETSEELTSLQRKLKGRPEAQKLDAVIASVKQQQEALRMERTTLSAPQQTDCPTCKRPYTNLPDHSARLAQIEQDSQKLAEELQKHQDARNKLPDFELISLRLDKHQQAMGKVAAAQATIAAIGELKEPLLTETDWTDLDDQIADLSARITKGRAIEQDVVRYEEQRKQFIAAGENRLALEQQITKLEKLVEYFGDKGPLKSKLIGGKFPAFLDLINGVLERFGFQCDVSLEPYSISVAHTNDDGTTYGPSLNLNQLSESELYRFGIAFQVALAEATGVGLVMIDRSDMLTADARQQLSIELSSSNLDQAFVLATGEPFNGELPEVDGVAFFELANTNGITTVERETYAAQL